MHSVSVLLPEVLGNRLILCLLLLLPMKMVLPLLIWLKVLVVPMLVLEQVVGVVVGVVVRRPIAGAPPVKVVGEGVRGPGTEVGDGAGVGAVVSVLGVGAAVRLLGVVAPMGLAIALLVTVSLPKCRTYKWECSLLWVN